mmetsp:Transcript_10841/g.18380  ORF Transcript_10841/g.18380 Transcript_10841/m.18380 type:complete len:347 (-) Transcript_10841:55-1095(-)
MGSEGRGSKVAGNGGERVEGSVNDATVLISEFADKDVDDRLDRSSDMTLVVGTNVDDLSLLPRVRLVRAEEKVGKVSEGLNAGSADFSVEIGRELLDAGKGIREVLIKSRAEGLCEGSKARAGSNLFVHVGADELDLEGSERSVLVTLNVSGEVVITDDCDSLHGLAAFDHRLDEDGEARGNLITKDLGKVGEAVVAVLTEGVVVEFETLEDKVNDTVIVRAEDIRANSLGKETTALGGTATELEGLVVGDEEEVEDGAHDGVDEGLELLLGGHGARAETAEDLVLRADGGVGEELVETDEDLRKVGQHLLLETFAECLDGVARHEHDALVGVRETTVDGLDDLVA